MLCIQENIEIADPKEHEQKNIYLSEVGSDEESENLFLKLFQAHAD